MESCLIHIIFRWGAKFEKMIIKIQKNILLLHILLIIIILFCGCGKSTNEISNKNNTITGIELFYGSEIIDNNYHIYIGGYYGHLPIVSNEAVIIKVNGETLTPEVDFIFPIKILDSATGFYITSPEANLAYINDRTDPSNGYQTGTIKILKPDLITSTSEVIVVYTYYKSILGRYISTGEGTVGPYHLEDVKNIVPGSETVQVWEEGSSLITTYTRNSSFEADAGNIGYAFNYDRTNPRIIFNEALSPNKCFQVIFQIYDDDGSLVR